MTNTEKEKDIKRIWIINTISLILILISFVGLYRTANLINNEMSFINYLKEKGDIYRININENKSISINNLYPEKLSFPLWLQIIMGIELGIILEIYRITFIHYRNEKQNRKEIQKEITSNP